MTSAVGTRESKGVLWARGFIALVLISNLTAAICFVVKPGDYAAAFELAGAPGTAAVIGVGILFLMWQVPYSFALIHPARHFISVVEALVMQLLGLAGETWLLTKIPADHPVLRGSILRFILFDALGAVVLAVALRLAFIAKQHAER